MQTLSVLMARHAGVGQVEWIGLRQGRLLPMRAVEGADLTADGLQGDHARPGPRALTLIQAEHLPVIAALARNAGLEPATLRRNLVVSGLNLAALREVPLRIGTALVVIGGPCAPCSRMEAALGPGGYNAMRGHGGWCARVAEAGRIDIGAAVHPA